jgi:hypothetical protein
MKLCTEIWKILLTLVISLEAFAATEFSQMFSGGQPRKDVKVFFDVAGTGSVPNFRVLVVAW